MMWSDEFEETRDKTAGTAVALLVWYRAPKRYKAGTAHNSGAGGKKLIVPLEIQALHVSPMEEAG